MKIVLDLTKLVADGKLTAAQAEELKLLAARDTGFLAINILMAFGTIAVAAGVLFLMPSLITSTALAVILLAGGLLVSYRAGPHWTILGSAIVVVAALLLAGSLGSLLVRLPHRRRDIYGMRDRDPQQPVERLDCPGAGWCARQQHRLRDRDV
jgi:hypothetical protein